MLRIGAPNNFPIFKEMGYMIKPFEFKISDRLLGHKFGIGYELRAPGCFKSNHGYLQFGENWPDDPSNAHCLSRGCSRTGALYCLGRSQIMESYGGSALTPTAQPPPDVPAAVPRSPGVIANNSLRARRRWVSASPKLRYTMTPCTHPPNRAVGDFSRRPGRHAPGPGGVLRRSGRGASCGS